MGKRELLLILVFVALGTVVYQLTAPPAAAGQPAFSVAALLRSVRAHFRPETSKATVRREISVSVPATITSISVDDFRGRVTIIGTDRSDAAATMTTEVFGADASQAQTDVTLVHLGLRPSGSTLQVVIERPSSRRQPLAELQIQVPRRLGVELTARGEVQVQGVAAVRLDTRSSAVTVLDIDGAVSGEHRDGALSIFRASESRVHARRSTVRLEAITGSVDGEFLDGRVALREIGGNISLDVRRADVEIENAAAGVRVSARDGATAIRRPSGPVEYEGQRSRLLLVGSQPAVVTATSADAPIEVHLPPTGGITLDAEAMDGRVELSDPTIKITHTDSSQSAAGPLGGGGPVWKLRTSRADITVRAAGFDAPGPVR